MLSASVFPPSCHGVMWSASISSSAKWDPRRGFYLPDLECNYRRKLNVEAPVGGWVYLSSTHSGCTWVWTWVYRHVSGESGYYPDPSHVRGYWKSYSISGWDYIRKITIHA